jgi:N-acetylglutamate synthase-like GNAT family acetyltransferase
MCALRENDGIRPDLTPWLGSLMFYKRSQHHGVGQRLVDAVKVKAKTMGFETLYLFAFDPTIPAYYERLGWKTMGMDEFKGHPVTVIMISL